ncbi:hypothetical protein HHE03_14400 [Helicobacter heilmannii]|nr:hypothetical protein HHE03_14400 [Helicobacter heilmannii]
MFFHHFKFQRKSMRKHINPLLFILAGVSFAFSGCATQV